MKTRRERSLTAVFLFTIAVVIVASAAMRFAYNKINHDNKPAKRSYSLLGYLDTIREGLTLTTIAEASTQGKAALVPAIAATKLIQSNTSFTVEPLKKFTFEVGYKNSGSATWQPNEDSKKSITLRARAKSESYFYDPSWKSGTIVMNAPRSASPGELVYFQFTFEAPKKEGHYNESLSLYFDGREIKGSEFVLPITVAKNARTDPTSLLSTKSSSIPPAPVQKKAVSLASANQDIERFLEAFKIIQSDVALTLQPGEQKIFEVGYKNIGRRAWKMADAPKLMVRAFTDKERSIYFDPTTWHDPHVATFLQSDADTGQVSYFRFFIKAPSAPGKYKEMFYLALGSEPIVGSDFVLPMEVVQPQISKPSTISPEPSTGVDAAKQSEKVEENSTGMQVEQPVPAIPPSPANQTTLAFALEQQEPPKQAIIEDIQEKEPLIRIGYFKTNEPVKITASSPYQIWTGNDLVSIQPASAVTTITYEASAGLYTSIGGGITHTSIDPPRFTGMVTDSTVLDPETIFEITSYQNRPAWSSEINDNTVRGAVEVRYSSEGKVMWAINELPLEYYLRGLAETSNNSPYEFQKALIIAARTYAKYHIDRSTKYLRDKFTIRSTDADQVYRGYGAEKRLPNVRKAVDETRGVIVTYQGELAITPYYSQSDGRTRSWEEVWAGAPKPWLVGKEDPPGRGLPLLGHGVGMAARGAIAMALGGKSFDEILKYYYTGIELRRRY
ncbi:SpoIID/LytB domain-containing protein [Candidatus Uhrbacteria bacterium]|nr:SpoIID/LytB domain-containing protein [Candidatus Uhrbacteria bacterium]